MRCCCLPCFGKRKNKNKNNSNDKPPDKVDISPISSGVRRSKMEKMGRKKSDFSDKKSPDVKPRRLYELRDKFRCLFCGGKNCKHENYHLHKNPAIYGLNSDQIDENIFASQRPSNVLIKKYNLVQSFKEKNIGLIVNLQRQGEHPYCGPNDLDEISGFSYTPSLFSSEGIRVRMSGWKDMDVPDSLPFMLEIVKDMYSTVNEGRKVLVHCHAGYGRTGIVIACYMIFTSNLNAEEAVGELRKRREKCIEKNTQMDYCKKFKECKLCSYLFIVIDRTRTTFTTEKTDVDCFLKYQIDLSFGSDVVKYAFVPKLMLLAFEAIVNLHAKNNLTYLDIYKSLNGTFELSDEVNVSISALTDAVNQGQWESLEACGDINIIAEMLYIWLDTSVKACVLPSNVKRIFENEKFNPEYHNALINPEGQTEDIRSETYNFIGKFLRKYEFEILKHVAFFLVKISPETWTNQLQGEFQMMIEKLSIYILGYNIDMLYNDQDGNPIPNRELNIDIVNKNILILQFLSASFKLDDDFLESANTIIPLKTLGSCSNKKFGDDFTSMALNFSETVMAGIRPCSDKKTFQNIPNSFTNISSDVENNTEKEQVLWGMYAILRGYFEKNKNPPIKIKTSTDDILPPVPSKKNHTGKYFKMHSPANEIKNTVISLIAEMNIMKNQCDKKVVPNIIEAHSSEVPNISSDEQDIRIQKIEPPVIIVNNESHADSIKVLDAAGNKKEDDDRHEKDSSIYVNKVQLSTREVRELKKNYTNSLRPKMRAVKGCNKKAQSEEGDDFKINFHIFSPKHNKELEACKKSINEIQLCENVYSKQSNNVKSTDILTTQMKKKLMLKDDE